MITKTTHSYEIIMGNVRLNIEYDLLQKSIVSSSFKFNKRENGPNLRPTNHIYFVICNSCYWCASYFCIDDLNSLSRVLRCHLCNSLQYRTNTHLIKRIVQNKL